VILGTFGSILANLTLDQWIKLAPAAIEFVSAAVKLGENIEPIIAKQGAAIKAKAEESGHIAQGAIVAHQQWRAAWTAADQRAADFQDGARGS
jgi:hypothetical protein